VVEALNSNGAISSAGAPIIEDCQDLVKDIVQHCYRESKALFRKKNRESNKVAHELASFAWDNPPAVWLDIPPGFLLPLIVDDVTIA
jgi:hypothetical protein